MSEDVKLSELENPVMKLSIPNGESEVEKVYELYDLFEQAENIQRERETLYEKCKAENKPLPNSVKTTIDDVKKLFGFPLKVGTKSINLTNNQAIALWKKFQEIVKKEEERAKKI